MVGQQFTPEQRNFLALEYHRLRGQYNCINMIKELFVVEFPDVAVQIPIKNTIKRVWRKQNTSFSVHNPCRKNSPGDS